MKDKKQLETEASTTAGIKGFSMSPGFDPEKPDEKNVPRKKIEEELEDLIVKKIFAGEEEKSPKNEVVRKRGERWVIFDDDNPKVEIGSYPSRETAWERQRTYRNRKKYLKKIEKKRKEKDIGTKLGIAAKDKQTERGDDTAPVKKFSTKESKDFLSSIIDHVLNEGFIARITEEAPPDQKSQEWENFFNRLSDTVKLSDPKIKPIIEKIEASKGKVLRKSIAIIQDTLAKAGSFTIGEVKVAKDPSTKEWKADFTITMKKNKKSLPVSVKLFNNKPVIFYPDSTKAELDKLIDAEGKTLKAELIHIQETQLDNLLDVVSMINKRDLYLEKLAKEVESKLKGLTGVQLSILKYLVKTKYGSVK